LGWAASNVTAKRGRVLKVCILVVEQVAVEKPYDWEHAPRELLVVPPARSPAAPLKRAKPVRELVAKDRRKPAKPRRRGRAAEVDGDTRDESEVDGMLPLDEFEQGIVDGKVFRHVVATTTSFRKE
jgi:hypothetical protein